MSRYTPTNRLSPYVACRSILSEENHHRTESGVDLSALDDLNELSVKGESPGSSLRDRIRSRSLSQGSDDFQLMNPVSSKSQLDEFDVDAAKGDLAGPSQWSEDKQLHATAISDSSEDDDAKVPFETAVPSPQRPRRRKLNPQAGRLLIVANRLPVSMKVVKKESDDGSGKKVNEISFTSSSGGLVSALGGCNMESLWLGWPGAEVRRASDRDTVRKKVDELNCVPVFLSQKVCDPFYNGFCNNLLWPLFHYLPLPVESITLADSQFAAYQVANSAFADVVLRTYEEGDIVWIHDYHLMLLPRILREKHPSIKIGFFFHTPFPAFEIYRVMPCRTELLTGVLSADLIGFHTPDYQRHFQDSCVRILGAAASGNTVTFDGFQSRLGAFPIGIDPKRFIDTIETEASREIVEEYKKEFQGKTVLLGIDRLDYIKGIQHKIFALERLFEKHPHLAQEVVLVQIAVPSRTDVVEYQKLRASTHKLVGRVNGLYGGVGSAPISYLDQSISFERMCALYRVADAMVITSVRDGMNLVAYEYIACQKDMAGTLILSEFTGAAQTFGRGPITVNPWSINSVCDAMYQSLTMSESDRRERSAAMFEHVTTHTASAWARHFLAAVLEATGSPAAWLKDLEKESTDHTTRTHTPIHIPRQPSNSFLAGKIDLGARDGPVGMRVDEIRREATTTQDRSEH